MQSHWNKTAAKKCFQKLLKRLTYVPRVIITDQLKSLVPRRGTSYLGWNIASTALSITARRTPISPPASASGAYRASSPQDMRRGSSPPMVSSPHTFDRDGTGSPPSSIVKRWPNDSGAGMKSRGLSPPKASDGARGLSLLT